MGCNCSRDGAKVVLSQQISRNKNHFVLKIHNIKTENIKIIFFEGKKDYMLLSDLLNRIFFGGENDELDANFTSKYNKKKDEFEYYIQRLVGLEIENEEEPLEGKIWVPYINQNKYNWSYLCCNNRVINGGDQLELKYEKFEEEVL